METKEENPIDDNGNPTGSTLPTPTDQTQVQPIMTDFEPMENNTDNCTVNIVNPSGSTSRTCPTKVKITIVSAILVVGIIGGGIALGITPVTDWNGSSSVPEKNRPPTVADTDDDSSFTVELQVEIPLKVQYSEELANPKSKQFKALETEMFDLFSDMLADEIENGSDLEIDVNVRPPAPTRRKRRSGEASVDVNVKLHNKLPSKTGDDVNVAQTTAIEKSKDIADLISNNIVDEINNYEGSFIDKAAANDVVVSKPNVTFTTTSATTTRTTTTTKATTTKGTTKTTTTKATTKATTTKATTTKATTTKSTTKATITKATTTKATTKATTTKATTTKATTKATTARACVEPERQFYPKIEGFEARTDRISRCLQTCGNEGNTVPTREGRIIGGKEPIYEKTYPKYRHSWPFIVKLGIVFPSSYWFSGPEYSKGGTCGGTVLNNRNRSQI